MLLLEVLEVIQFTILSNTDARIAFYQVVLTTDYVLGCYRIAVLV